MPNGTGHGTIMLTIDESRCAACSECLAKAVCRGSAIRVIDRGEAPFLDMSRCWGCLLCVAACPCEAIIRQDEMPEAEHG